MKPPVRVLILLFILAANAHAVRHHHSPTPTPSPTATPALAPDPELDSIAEEFLRGYLMARPALAVSLGFHEYDGRVNDFTRLSIDAEIARLKRFDERLKVVDAAKLSPRAGIDLRLLQMAIHRELFQIQELGIYEHNPMTYASAIEVNTYLKRNFAPIEDRVRAVINVENQAPNVVIAAKTNLVDSLPQPYVELAIQTARGSADFLRKDLVQAVGELKDGNLQAAFIASNRKATGALTEYANWLEKEKLPKATAPFALGGDKFSKLLAETELIDLPPAKLLEIGLAELKREQEAFTAAGKEIDPARSPLEVYKSIQGEHPTSADLLPTMAKQLDSVRRFVLDAKLVSIPSEVRAQLKETPQYRRATSFASMDTPGPFEKKGNEAYYYVTPPENDWPETQKNEWLTSFNNYSADVVTIHEAYPGHYVQFLHLNASPATKLEKIVRSYAFVEGWAHYCEKMVLDAGYGRSPNPQPTEEEKQKAAKFRMAQADQALLRLCRLCVSIKMHTEGMSVDEAARFFIDNCYLEPKPARAEAMRGTFDPGYLNYSLGKLEILKLRKDVENQEGAEFNQQKFHDELLNHGMLPIRLLREIFLKDKAKWPEVL